ncbi:MAG: phosphoribosylamine--glycine ligase [SAR324 cluster bacterium]|nr:phosphoribosylamine--glycine ligase [SAR324 cluster bacterium]
MKNVHSNKNSDETRVLILGVGSFAHSMMTILQEAGAEVACYLTREYGHYGPASVGETWLFSNHASPVPVIKEFCPDFIIPMAISWYTAPWAKELLETQVPILCPTGNALQIEAGRQFAEQLCRRFDIAFPFSCTVNNRLEALQLMKENPRPYVLKNPLCSPFSPIHTIVCETVEDTIGWLDRIDYAEGVFLQEYLGVAEAGHFVFVSDGKIKSLVTNQEYKRAFTGNMGPVAGAPLGGIVEQDPEDQYGLARELICPLLPWFKETKFHGPLQVTAIQKNGKWHAIEYNTRLGVTSGAMILRMLENPLDAVRAVVKNRPVALVWNSQRRYGCSLTLAGYGYPYTIPNVPRVPIIQSSQINGDLWWNEVEQHGKQLYTAHHKVPIMGHRLADCITFSDQLASAIQQAYDDMQKIHCLGSYYRLDIGQSLWPPGKGY